MGAGEWCNNMKTTKTYKAVAAASEKLGLAYHLIPPEALRRLSRIFLEGEIKYPGAAVNARNIDSAVGNDPWQEERFNHAVDHLLKFGQGDTTEDHLAKVMWFCSVMIEIRNREGGDNSQ